MWQWHRIIWHLFTWHFYGKTTYGMSYMYKKALADTAAMWSFPINSTLEVFEESRLKEKKLLHVSKYCLYLVGGEHVFPPQALC